jgi:cell division protein FtsN
MPKMRNSNIIPVCIVAGMIFPGCQPAAMADEVSYASEIVQYVQEDKVYLLEKIRPQLTKPSELILVEALLSEDGPKAAGLYRKQLAEYPDTRLDPVSRSRLASFEQARAVTPGLPVMPAKASSISRPPAMATGSRPTPSSPSASKPDSSFRRLPEKPVMNQTARKGDTTHTTLPVPPRPQVAATAPGGGYTLQFGSFDSITNADQLSAQLSPTAPASVQQINGIYKVRLKRSFATRQEAAAYARSLPIESFVVSLQP